ncbi:PEP-CTERM domain protein [Oopsacas minuta]|uniref:PEP-CTERM domain protein n=1 Tax=Oopsacas minuta TaxID=111878 RepID=A0AAV7KCY5_9METZ|nr:PEP-CTERM domain protein [Oopsacas minuta]
MASIIDENQNCHPLDKVAKQIEGAFDKLVQLVLSRKISLLTELNDYRNEYDKFTADMLQTEKNLEVMKQKTADTLQTINISEIEEKLHKLTLSTTSFELDFQINSHIIEQEISKLGKIIKASELIVPNYSVMKMPVVAVGKEGSGRDEFDGPRGIAYEEGSGLIFVSDNSSIKIFTSSGEFVNDFGSNELVNPWGIALNESYIYVSDRNQCSVLKYQRFNYKFLMKTGQEGSGKGEFHFPMQIAVRTDGCLFIPENKNSRISILDSELNFERFISHESVIKPVDIKFAKDKMFVLCYNIPEKVHQFNFTGDYLKCVIAYGGGATLFFCLDVANNILISNWTTNTILIYNQAGVLVCTIGKVGHGKGEFSRPYGIVTTSNARLIVSSNNNNYGLQIF